MDINMTKAIIVLSIHFIGGLITLYISIKDGTMEEAAKHGDGIYKATPSDVVFQSMLFWEFGLFIYLFFCLPESLINNYFRNKYNSGDKNNDK